MVCGRTRETQRHRDFSGVAASRLPEAPTEVETAVFRIVQEALTNVFRHSDAHKVSISLSQSNGMISVTVKDDGRGIGQNIAELRPDSVGVGIGGMKQRARELGGELRLINAQPGTVVELSYSLQLRFARP